MTSLLSLPQIHTDKLLVSSALNLNSTTATRCVLSAAKASNAFLSCPGSAWARMAAKLCFALGCAQVALLCPRPCPGHPAGGRSQGSPPTKWTNRLWFTLEVDNQAATEG